MHAFLRAGGPTSDQVFKQEYDASKFELRESAGDRFSLMAFGEQDLVQLALSDLTIEQVIQIAESANAILGECGVEAEDCSFETLTRFYAQVITFDEPTDFRFTWRGGSKETVEGVVEVMIKTNGLYYMKDSEGEWHTSDFGNDVMTDGWIYVVIGELVDMDPDGLRRKIFDLAEAEEVDRPNFIVRLKFSDLVERLNEEDICDECQALHIAQPSE